MTDRPEIVVTLRAEPARPGEPPAAIRLRQLLKLALRAFRFKALDVKCIEPNTGPAGELRVVHVEA